MEDKIPQWMLNEWMRQPLQWKIERSKLLIRQFYKELDGQVHISTSGGKDSDVLLDLVRTEYPGTPAIHVAVPRYPETAKHVREDIDNCTILVPKKSFKWVIEKYGYPVVSKEVAVAISRYRGGDDDVRRYRLYGIKKDGTRGKLGVIPKRWRFLIDAPFKISDQCCNVIKKNPLMAYAKKTGTRPFTGIMVGESHRRLRNYRKTGCNIFKEGKEMSMPLSFWTEKDIWKYIGKFDVPYSPIYDLGETRTGCLFCLFGCHREKTPNRFQRLYHQHPKIYKYCMDGLGLREVMEYVGLDSTPIGKIEDYLLYN